MRFCPEHLERRELLAANLVADINQLASQSSNPRDFVNLGQQTFFVADSALGTELWKTDGTAEGTQLVTDIEPGPAGSFPTNLTPLRGVFLFHVGNNVWRSDGSEAGTFELIPDTRLLAASDRFAITKDGHVTDGTPDGTKPIDVSFRAPSNIEHPFVATDDAFFFTLSNSSRLFKLDPRTGETERLVTRIQAIEIDNDVFILSNDDSQTRIRPMDSGEEGGFLAPFQLARQVLAPVSANGITYFEISNNGTTETWRTDGTENGTFHLEGFPVDLNDVTVGSNPGELWFIASDQFGEELWRTDGTIAGTGRVKDIFRGVLGSRPSDFLVNGDDLWFTADDGVSGRQVWISDGTSTGTKRITTSNGSSDSPEPSLLGAVGRPQFGFPSRIYFRAESRFGVELWTIDPLTLTPRMVKDILPGEHGSYPSAMHVMLGGTVLFTATGPDGTELWTTNGTERGTELLKDIYSGNDTASSHPNNFAAFGDQLYFVANDGIHGSELWRFDGTDVSMVADIHTGPQGSAPEQLVAVGDTLYFSADDGRSGRELWAVTAIDGIPQAARRVADILPGELAGTPDELVGLEDRLYFVANIGASADIAPDDSEFLTHRGLYSTNGTDLRLEFETDAVAARVGPGQIDLLTEFEGQLYFFEVTPSLRENRLHRLTPGANDSEDLFTALNVSSTRALRGALAMEKNDDALIFTGLDEDGRPAFFVIRSGTTQPVQTDTTLRFTNTDVVIPIGDQFFSDGRLDLVIDAENATATSIRSIGPVSEGIKIGDRSYIVIGDTIVTGNLATNDIETVVEIDSRFGLPAQQPRELTEWRGDLYYIVDNPATNAGSQIWRLDSELNNEMMTNIGAPNSQISSLFVFNDELYFMANDGQLGVELWRLDGESIRGDFNTDGQTDSIDIDLLLAAIGSNDSDFDLDSSGEVDVEDLNILIEDVLQTKVGDIDLDGTVGFADYLFIADAFESKEDPGWSDGDLNGDGEVDFADFLLLSSNFD